MGLLLNKDLAAGMLAHARAPIPATLTAGPGLEPGAGAGREARERAKELRKLAAGLFKNVLGFMGDRIMPYPAMLAQELIKAGHENAEVRPWEFPSLSGSGWGSWSAEGGGCLRQHCRSA